jgi:hypothetical protein
MNASQIRSLRRYMGENLNLNDVEISRIVKKRALSFKDNTEKEILKFIEELRTKPSKVIDTNKGHLLKETKKVDKKAKEKLEKKKLAEPEKSESEEEYSSLTFNLPVKNTFKDRILIDKVKKDYSLILQHKEEYVLKTRCLEVSLKSSLAQKFKAEVFGYGWIENLVAKAKPIYNLLMFHVEAFNLVNEIKPTITTGYLEYGDDVRELETSLNEPGVSISKHPESNAIHDALGKLFNFALSFQNEFDLNLIVITPYVNDFGSTSFTTEGLAALGKATNFRNKLFITVGEFPDALEQTSYLCSNIGLNDISVHCVGSTDSFKIKDLIAKLK